MIAPDYRPSPSSDLSPANRSRLDSSRNPCSATSTVLPSWHTTAIGSGTMPKSVSGMSARAVVSPMRKMKLLMRVQGTLMLSTEHLQAPVLPETRFLIEAAAAAPFTASTAKSLSGGPIRRAGRRLVWMLELFEELDRRERLRALSASSGDESLA